MRFKMTWRRIKYSCQNIIWGIKKTGGGGGGAEEIQKFIQCQNYSEGKKVTGLSGHFASLVVLKKASPIPHHIDTPLRCLSGRFASLVV